MIELVRATKVKAEAEAKENRSSVDVYDACTTQEEKEWVASGVSTL